MLYLFNNAIHFFNIMNYLFTKGIFAIILPNFCSTKKAKCYILFKLRLLFFYEN